MSPSDGPDEPEPDRLAELIGSSRVAAPEGLRRQVAEMQARPPRQRWPALALGLSVLAGAGVLASSLLLGGRAADKDEPTAVARAAAASLRPPTRPAPPPRSERPALLDVDSDGLPFPDWAPGFGFRAAGVRVDSLAGRRVVSVLYVRGRTRLGYAIAARPALPLPTRAAVRVREGTKYRVFTAGGRDVLTWRREGRTCVLAARGLGAAALLDLATGRGLRSARPSLAGRPGGLY